MCDATPAHVTFPSVQLLLKAMKLKRTRNLQEEIDGMKPLKQKEKLLDTVDGLKLLNQIVA